MVCRIASSGLGTWKGQLSSDHVTNHPFLVLGIRRANDPCDLPTSGVGLRALLLVVVSNFFYSFRTGSKALASCLES